MSSAEPVQPSPAAPCPFVIDSVYEPALMPRVGRAIAAHARQTPHAP